MEQILKRLELIKTGIAIEDEEIIEMQTLKIASLNADDDVEEILRQLEDSNFAGALAGIEEYLTRYSGVVLYLDQELGGLKMELKALESELQLLSEEKNDYLNEINEFNIQYNLHLGGVIRKILELKNEILYHKTILKRRVLDEAKAMSDALREEIDALKKRLKQMKSELDGMDALDDEYDELLEEFKSLKEEYRRKTEEFDDLQEALGELEEEYENDPDVEEYEEAKQDYEEFNQEYEEIIQEERFDLSDEERKELKKAYRKACKLCHPDIVPDDLQEQALRLMQQLNDAYGTGNLTEVLKILKMLESGGGFEVASDQINDKEVLRAKISEIRSKIVEINEELDAIRDDDTYQTVQELDDWEEYFADLKDRLSEEQEALERQVQALTSAEEEQPEKKEPAGADDDYWDLPF
jgi:chromosome segregation ATPase